VKSKVKGILIIFFDIIGAVHKEFVLAGQTVNSAYTCDVVWQLHENVKRFRPELWRQKNWLLHHDNAPSPGNFLPKTIWLSSPTLLTSRFPSVKMKLKRCHCDIAAVLEAESQTVLNILTEHDFCDLFKKVGTVHMHGRGLLPW
jgi:hypothetical protein